MLGMVVGNGSGFSEAVTAATVRSSPLDVAAGNTRALVWLPQSHRISTFSPALRSTLFGRPTAVEKSEKGATRSKSEDSIFLHSRELRCKDRKKREHQPAPLGRI